MTQSKQQNIYFSIYITQH